MATAGIKGLTGIKHPTSQPVTWLALTKLNIATKLCLHGVSEKNAPTLMLIISSYIVSVLMTYGRNIPNTKE